MTIRIILWGYLALYYLSITYAPMKGAYTMLLP